MASASASTSTAQEDEYQALEAIYMEELVPLVPVWNKRHFQLILRPRMPHHTKTKGTKAKEEEVKLVLTVTMPTKYPKSQPPVLSLAESQGIEEATLATLKQQLVQICQAKLGDPSIYDVAVEAQRFLDERYGEVSNKGEEARTLYQDMISRQKQHQESIQQQLLEKEQSERRKEETATRDLHRRIGENVQKRSAMKKEKKQGKDKITSPLLGHTTAVHQQGPSDLDLTKQVNDGEDQGFNRNHKEVENKNQEYDSGNVFLHPTASVESRYQTDFEQISCLGEGGFGKVLKVRNRLDGMFYAIKVIKLEKESLLNKKVLREVTTLSRLHHRYIVRYFQAWLESSDATKSNEDSEDETETDSESGSTTSKTGRKQNENAVATRAAAQSEYVRDVDGNLVDVSVTGSNEYRDSSRGDYHRQFYPGANAQAEDWMALDTSSGGINRENRFQVMESSDSDSSYEDENDSSSSDDSSSDDDSSKSDSEEDRHERSNEGGYDTFDENSLALPENTEPSFSSLFERSVRHTDTETTQDEEADQAQRPQKSRRQYLYIQMEFCPGETLRELLDKDVLNEQVEKIWRFFTQIVEALSYLQNRGVVHRDLKPPNLFIDAEECIKIGDFGLATGEGEDYHSQTGVSNSKQSDAQETSVTVGVGTTLYRAPELDPQSPPKKLPERTDKRFQQYDIKADMFSLGVIFFEMWREPFSTKSERYHILMMLRKLPPLEMKHIEKSAVSDEKSMKKAAMSNLSEELRDLFEKVPTQAVILIRWLLSTDPLERPSADDILESKLLPRRGEIDEAYLEEAVKAISQNGSHTHEKLMNTLFAQPTEDTVDFTFDLDPSSAKFMNGASVDCMPYDFRPRLLLETLYKSMIAVFERHGAVCFEAPPLMPKPADIAAQASASRQRDSGLFSDPLGVSLLSMSRRADVGKAFGATAEEVTSALQSFRGMSFGTNMGGVGICSPGIADSVPVYLDRSGTVISLPFDLCEPFARRKSHGLCSHPKELNELDYDIVWNLREENKQKGGNRPTTFLGIPDLDPWCIVPKAACAETEILFVSAEVASLISGDSTSYFVRINNAKILRGLMDFASVPIPKRAVVAQALSSAIHTAATRAQSNRLGTKKTAKDTKSKKPSKDKKNKNKAANETPKDLENTEAAGGLSEEWTTVRRFLLKRVGLTQATADSLKVFFGLSPFPLVAVEELCRFVEEQWQPMYMKLQSMEQESSSRQRRAGRTSLSLKLRLAGLTMLAEGLYEIRSTLVNCLRIIKSKIKFVVKEDDDLLDDIPSEPQDLRKKTFIPFARILEKLRERDVSKASDLHNHLFGFLQFLSSMRLDIGFAEKNGKYAHAFVFQTVLSFSQKEPKKKKKTKNEKISSVDIANASEEELIADFASLGLKSPIGTDRDCIAKGGRYDDLILRFKLPGDSVELPVAVGVRFALDKIGTTLMNTLEQQSNGAKRLRFLTRSCDVLVCTPSSGSSELIQDKIAVACRLWSQNIRTEHIHPTPATFEELAEYCQKHGIPIMVLLSNSITTESDTVQVRSLDTSIPSIDVPIDSLAREVSAMLGTYISNNLRNQQSKDSQGGILSQLSRKSANKVETNNRAISFDVSGNQNRQAVPNIPLAELDDSEAIPSGSEDSIRTIMLQSLPPFLLPEIKNTSVFVTHLENIYVREIISAIEICGADVATAVKCVNSDRVGAKLRSVKAGIRKCVQSLLRGNLDKQIRYCIIYSTTSKCVDYCSLVK